MIKERSTGEQQLTDKLGDIVRNPHKHVHDYDGLFECCMHDVALNSQLLDAHRDG